MKKILLFTFLATSAFAENLQKKYDELLNYSEEESDNFVLKMRVFGMYGDGKQESLPAPIKQNTKSIDKLITTIFGAETGVQFFFTKHFAAELNAGLALVRMKSQPGIVNNYSTTESKTKAKDVYAVPASLVGQYYIAPYGGLSPYVGGGIGYLAFFARSNQFEIQNTYSPILQGGVEFITRDGTSIGFDVKKYLSMKIKVKYKKPFVDNNVTSTVKYNPFVFSISVGKSF